MSKWNVRYNAWRAYKKDFSDTMSWYLYQVNRNAIKAAYKLQPLEYCNNHTGKMEDMFSISTNPATNPNCLNHCQVDGSICQHCYSMDMNNNLYPALKAKNQRNTDKLIHYVIGLQYLPVINPGKYPYVRFESFGDLHNKIQFINYLNICKVNPDINFTIWTKNPWIMRNVFQAGYKKPENLQIILSGLFLDRFIDLIRIYPFADKIFTVWSNETTCKKAGYTWNCPKRCKDCLKCYNPEYKKPEYSLIHELLK